MLDNCTLCPHECGINRLKGYKGRCKCDDKIKIALASLHMFEEPCITGKNGSGTVFFSHCNLNCVYCQNYEISQLQNGKEISIQELADIFIEQQNKGAENINLVTPTMYVYQIIEAIKIAKANGLKIPIVYNSNGYESVETIKLLNGFIDVYLPDLKYSDNSLAKEYSNVNNYFEIATNAILEMYYQVGLPQFSEDGLIKKGVLIRHLILPNHVDNSKKVLDWIKSSLPKDVYVSIMAQYFPTYKAHEYENLNRKIYDTELEEIKNYLSFLGIHNGYIQELGTHEEEYVPNFKIN
ncbi:MAG: radical SAM protein [Clostridia bacterium]|nr:radical SAM protein [Clostridia bacterium]